MKAIREYRLRKSWSVFLISSMFRQRKDAEVVRRLVAYMRAAGENADRRKKHPEDSLLEEDLPDDEQ